MNKMVDKSKMFKERCQKALKEGASGRLKNENRDKRQAVLLALTYKELCQSIKANVF
jgi:secreted Zn-dependent insulinase-like peptidase